MEPNKRKTSYQNSVTSDINNYFAVDFNDNSNSGNRHVDSVNPEENMMQFGNFSYLGSNPTSPNFMTGGNTNRNF